MRSNDQFITDELLELFALHQLFCAYIEDKGAVGRPQQAVDFVNPDVAVLSRLPDGQRHFQVDRDMIPFAVRL